mmetsp:Transcript_27693/g.41015  ORF Transcript_27693/g.41015 Transcript_27693/m.41015 type:complete len:179 (-) Transcript_27693:1940-2476(-)
MTGFIAIKCLLILILALAQHPVQVHCTNVKWTGNNDPNAPEAAKVPRSQKYWDDNNIERPDYAKTDAEIYQEKKKDTRSNRSGGTGTEGTGSYDAGTGTSIVLWIGFFVGMWALIAKFGMKNGLNLGGNRLGSSSSTSGYSQQFMNTFGKKKEERGDSSLEEKARQARLARFESTKDD